MDLSGISVLIESHQKAIEVGTTVKLEEISKSVLKVIMMAKLEQVLEFGLNLNGHFSVSKDFVVNSKSLKDVRDFAEEVFDKSPIFSEQKDELVLAIAEAAQNIVKHAYKDIIETKDVSKLKYPLKIMN